MSCCASLPRDIACVQLAVAITPNLLTAAVISGAFYGLMNLFAGSNSTHPRFERLWRSLACILLAYQQQLETSILH